MKGLLAVFLGVVQEDRRVCGRWIWIGWRVWCAEEEGGRLCEWEDNHIGLWVIKENGRRGWERRGGCF